MVHCDIRRCTSTLTLGFRILVESQYPLQFVHDTIEDSIELLGEYLATTIDEAAFERNKAALIVSKREAWNGRMRDRADTLWREVLDETFDFQRSEAEIRTLETRVTLEAVRAFYAEWIRAGGRHRRHLIVSIGPDPILNKLDMIATGTVRHWDLKELPLFRKGLESFVKLRQGPLQKWLQSVFESEPSALYQPPPVLCQDSEESEINKTESEGVKYDD